MNRCFVIGKIIEKGNFKFILNKKIKHKSRIEVKIKLQRGNIVQAVAFDSIADYVLRKKLKNVFIYGSLRNIDKQLKVEIIEIREI